MHRARAQSAKINSDRADGHCYSFNLLGFNDLERWVAPAFLFRNRFYLQLSPHCPKMNKKSMWEGKKIHDLRPRDIESCHHTAASRVKLWSLNANLLFGEANRFINSLNRSI